MKLENSYNNIISLENLLIAWKEFLKGKKSRKDAQIFQRDLMQNIISLHNDLKNKTYSHSSYEAFSISDPKPRNIHKAGVRDRLIHHALYRQLHPFFDRKFIYDSYSCRFEKGTHKANKRFHDFAHKASNNHTKTLWVLKCDIRKFFASIDHGVLKKILLVSVSDGGILWLFGRIIDSFHSEKNGVGLPLGNLTSQLLVNIYMNEFDHFVKQELKVEYYIRYADDFVILSQNKECLEIILIKMQVFLSEELKLQLHPDKVFIKTLASGVDFLGWVHFPHHRILRTTTKKRMFKKIRASDQKSEVAESYVGLLKHGNAHYLQDFIKHL